MYLNLATKSILLAFLLSLGTALYSQNKLTYIDTSIKTKIKKYNSLSQSFIQAKADSTNEYAFLGLWELYKTKDNISQAEFYKNLGKSNADNRQYKLALLNYNYAAALFEKTNNQSQTAIVYNSIGIIYGKIYDYEKAFFYIHKSISILVKVGDNRKISASLNNLGVIYRGLKNYNKSVEIFQQALYFARKSGDEEAIASSLNNFSISYYENQNYKEALKYQLDAIKIYEKFKNKKRLCSSYIILGSIYNKLNNKIAIDYFFKSSKLAAELNDQFLVAYAFQCIGSEFLFIKNYPLAFKYLLHSDSVATKIQDWGCIKNINEVLTDYYEKTGDYKKALERQKLFKRFNDSIYNKDSKNRFVDLQVKYEVEEKDNENKILKQETTIQHLAIEKQTYLRNAFIAVSIFITLLVLLMLYRYYLKRKANKALSEKNQQINLQKNQLEEAYATKDKLFAIITHDLKNPFGTIISLANFIEESFSDMDDKHKMQAITTIKKSADSAYELLENLTKWLLSQNKNTPINTSRFDISISLQTIITLYRIEAENKNIEIFFKNPTETFVIADEQMIKTIIRNLISNAIKFTPINGKISIELTDMKQDIQVTIKDTGIGIKEEDKEKIFKIGSNFTTTGTAKEKGSGLGLILAKEFADRNNSKIWFETEVGKGSNFYFSVLKANKNAKN